MTPGNFDNEAGGRSVSREQDANSTLTISKSGLVATNKLWFVVEGDQENKKQLPAQMAVSVGRDENQDIVIQDDSRTVSRRHLILKNSGDRVDIEVIGANGLEIDGKVYAGQTVTVVPGVSFLVGEIKCRIEMEQEAVDTDKTVYFFRGDLEHESVARELPSKPVSEKPLPDVPNRLEHFYDVIKKIRSDGVEKLKTLEQIIVPALEQFRSSLMKFVESRRQGTYHNDSEFGPKTRPLGSEPLYQKYSNLIVGGTIAIVVIIALITVFGSDSQTVSVSAPQSGTEVTEEPESISRENEGPAASKNDNVAEDTQPAAEEVPAESLPALSEYKERIYKQWIDEAILRMEAEEWFVAKDYLMAIPKNSEYSDQARSLLKQINESMGK